MAGDTYRAREMAEKLDYYHMWNIDDLLETTALIAAYRAEIQAECAERAVEKAATFKLRAFDMGEWKEYKLDTLSIARLRSAVMDAN